MIVQHIQLVDHFSKNDLVNEVHGCYGNSQSEIALIRKLQDGVQGALMTFRDSKKDTGIGRQVDYSVDISLSMQDVGGCCHMTNGKDISGNDASVTLFRTSGVSKCLFRVKSGSCGRSLMGSTSFSLELPPFVCWVNFDLITMTLWFLKNMASCIETTRKESGFVRQSNSPANNTSNNKILEGNIFLPNARIILCFPQKEHKDFGSYSSCDQFIAFDFVSRPINGKDIRSAKPTPVASSDKRHTVTTSCSLNLNFGDFYLFSISSAITDKIVESETYNKEPSFSVEKIISAVNKTGHLSLVSMFWQEGPATGPWIARKAKLLASSENGRSEDYIVEKGCEFASVTTIKDSKDFTSRTRQEILSSSTFLLHGRLPPVRIHLHRSLYENLYDLLNQMFEHFSCIISESVRTREEQPATQTTFLVECDSVTVSVAIEPIGDVKCSSHSELPGSWCSLTLQVDKFELLSVSDIGGIRSANFLWLAHGQGSLWGSSTKGLPREFLLISCNDSTMGRGDGEGSNVLSSRRSGSDIINFFDPESKCNSTSITVRCATIVAIGGCLNWFNTIFSFFSPPSSEVEQAGDSSLDNKNGSSFVLNLVDVGLSYEPYCETSMANQGLKANETKDELYVAFMLAASSLKLSNTTVVDATEGEYIIRLHDIGMLICPVSEPHLIGRTYSVEHLNEIGYVKVAQEAHIKAHFRTNCENGYAWELECADSHIMLNTCHDTTFGLVRLAAQLQKLFAPDMQDYVVHLENRWNNVQQEFLDERTVCGELSTSLDQTESSSLNKKSKVGNLMDEIREDVFQLDGNSDGQTKFFESHLCTLVSDSPLVASGASSSEESIPDIIEEYFLSDLRPLSELDMKPQSSDMLCCKTGAVGEAWIGNGGWYSDTPLRILENHASKVEQNNVRKPVEFETSTSDPERIDVVKAEGRILLKNMNFTWRMYGGSDWSNSLNTSQTSVTTSARDATNCLELVLSGIEFDYDVYPDGEISASRLCLTIQDICLNDRSCDAPWKLVLLNFLNFSHFLIFRVLYTDLIFGLIIRCLGIMNQKSIQERPLRKL